jgi:hypothetical protein
MADEGTAAPIEIPVPTTGVPGSVPSGVAALRGGMVVPIPPWANTGLPQYEAKMIAMMKNCLMRMLHDWCTPQSRRPTGSRK